jgi:hypothetical protein
MTIALDGIRVRGQRRVPGVEKDRAQQLSLAKLKNARSRIRLANRGRIRMAQIFLSFHRRFLTDAFALFHGTQRHELLLQDGLLCGKQSALS